MDIHILEHTYIHCTYISIFIIICLLVIFLLRTYSYSDNVFCFCAKQLKKAFRHATLLFVEV